MPGSMLIYGSNFWMVTRSPLDCRSLARDAAMMPLPNDEATPPVTNTYFVFILYSSNRTSKLIHLCGTITIFFDLFHEGEEDSEDDQAEGDEVIPVDRLVLEHQCHYDCKYGEGDCLLDDFELDEVEWASVVDVADSVCRNHDAVFEECYAP